MPRDLAQLASLQPESLGRRDESSEDAQLPKRQATSQAAERSAKPGSALETLHPYTQQLTLADVESCYILEEATFPPQERCTREKVSVDIRAASLVIASLRTFLRHGAACMTEQKGRLAIFHPCYPAQLSSRYD